MKYALFVSPIPRGAGLASERQSATTRFLNDGTKLQMIDAAHRMLNSGKAGYAAVLEAKNAGKLIFERSIDFPHLGGCEHCQAEQLCNVCGTALGEEHGKCTNGRCAWCHAQVCGSGGQVAPGHGYGSHAAAVQALIKKRELRR